MNQEPFVGLLLIGLFAIVAGLSGVLAPDFWANANKNVNNSFGLPVGPGGSPRFVRIWSGLAVVIGFTLCTIFFAQLVF